jgi:hypothetical protein
MESMKRLKLISKSEERGKRPNLAELDQLMEHFAGRRSDSPPMQRITMFAIFSTRRQEEITRLQWLASIGPVESSCRNESEVEKDRTQNQFWVLIITQSRASDQ